MEYVSASKNLIKRNPNQKQKQRLSDIVHKMVYHKSDKEKRNGKIMLRRLYLCNQAVKASGEKLSLHWDKVTCKNCLRLKEE